MNRFFRPRRLALLLASGLLGTLSFPLAFSKAEVLPSGVLEPLAFVCLVPALVAIRGLRAPRAFGAGFLAGLVFFVGTLWWVANALIRFSPLPVPLCIFLMTLLAAWCALHWGLAFALVRAFAERNGWAAGLTVAPVWMAVELLRTDFCSGFPWANLGYSQARNLWLSQVASLLGVYGIAGLIALVNGALYELLRAVAWKERAVPLRLLGAAAGLVVAGHAYGALRVHTWDEKLARAPQLRVAVVQGNVDPRLHVLQGSDGALVSNAYNAPTSAADDAGADLIVWPEGSFQGGFMQGHPWSMQGQGLARSHYGGELLVGVDVYDPVDRRSENAAFLVTPDLHVASKYAKAHLVPFGEYIPLGLDRYLPLRNFVPGNFKAGGSLEVMAVPVRREGRGAVPARVGVEICFDAIFPELSRAYVRQGAQVLVNMTNDAWYGFSSAPYQFLRMVQLRAIETARPIARAANTGVSAFVDPVGRISQATALGLVERSERELDLTLKVPSEWRLAAVPVVSEQTVYVAVGDTPSYLAALFCVAGVAWGIRKGRRSGPIPRGSLGI
jgi:apolipoprotein N-acyltransferase